MVFLIIFVILSVFTSLSTSVTCPSDMLLCGDSLKCISSSKLCDYTVDCGDASDEMNFGLCKKLSKAEDGCQRGSENLNLKCKSNSYDSYSGSYTHSGYADQCLDIITACLRTDCLLPTNSLICNEIVGNKLKPVYDGKKELQENQTKFEIIAKENFYKNIEFISNAFNETIQRNFSTCPPLFIPFAEKCYSYFTPVQISWSDANLFCESISGKLAVLDDVLKFKTVLDYLKSKEIKSNFWIGGNLKLESNISTKCANSSDSTNSSGKFIWLDGNIVETGAPFWSLYTNQSSPLIDKCSTLSMMPTQKSGDRCIALLEANYYYFSDEDCGNRYSPLCVTHQMQEDEILV